MWKISKSFVLFFLLSVAAAWASPDRTGDIWERPISDEVIFTPGIQLNQTDELFRGTFQVTYRGHGNLVRFFNVTGRVGVSKNGFDQLVVDVSPVDITIAPNEENSEESFKTHAVLTVLPAQYLKHQTLELDNAVEIGAVRIAVNLPLVLSKRGDFEDAVFFMQKMSAELLGAQALAMEGKNLETGMYYAGFTMEQGFSFPIPEKMRVVLSWGLDMSFGKIFSSAGAYGKVSVLISKAVAFYTSMHATGYQLQGEDGFFHNSSDENTGVAFEHNDTRFSVGVSIRY